MSIPGNRTDEQKQYHPTNERPRSPFVIRAAVHAHDITALTPDTRVERLDIDTYYQPEDQWVKVSTFYTCQCGRNLGFYFQQPMQKPSTSASQVSTVVNPVVPAPSQNDTAITISSSANDSIISIASSSSSSLLTEVRREPANYLEDPYSAIHTNVSTMSTQSINELTLDSSMHSIED